MLVKFPKERCEISCCLFCETNSPTDIYFINFQQRKKQLILKLGIDQDCFFRAVTNLVADIQSQ